MRHLLFWESEIWVRTDGLFIDILVKSQSICLNFSHLICIVWWSYVALLNFAWIMHHFCFNFHKDFRNRVHISFKSKGKMMVQINRLILILDVKRLWLKARRLSKNDFATVNIFYFLREIFLNDLICHVETLVTSVKFIRRILIYINILSLWRWGSLGAYCKLRSLHSLFDFEWLSINS